MYQKVAHVSRCSSEQHPMLTVWTASQVVFTSFSFALASSGPPLGSNSRPGSPLSLPNQCAGSIRLTFSVVQPTPLCCRSCGQAMSHLLLERQGFRQNKALEVYFDFGPFAEANAWLLLPDIWRNGSSRGQSIVVVAVACLFLAVAFFFLPAPWRPKGRGGGRPTWLRTTSLQCKRKEKEKAASGGVCHLLHTMAKGRHCAWLALSCGRKKWVKNDVRGHAPLRMHPTPTQPMHPGPQQNAKWLIFLPRRGGLAMLQLAQQMWSGNWGGGGENGSKKKRRRKQKEQTSGRKLNCLLDIFHFRPAFKAPILPHEFEIREFAHLLFCC